VDAPVGEESRGADEEGVDPLAHKTCKGCVDVATGAGADDVDLQSHSAGSQLHVSQCSFRTRRVVWVDEHTHAFSRGHQLAQDFQSLCRQLTDEKIDTGRITARSRQTGDKTEPDRVFGGLENDWDGCVRRLGRHCRNRTQGGDHGDLPVNQIGHQLGQSIRLILGPAVYDRHVLAFDIVGILEALAECAQPVRDRIGRCAVEEADHRHRRLLRPRRERP
jgi:hypothetical protein